MEESKLGSPFQFLTVCVPQIHEGLNQLLHTTMSFFNTRPIRSVCTFTYAITHYLSALWLMRLLHSSRLPLAQINFCHLLPFAVHVSFFLIIAPLLLLSFAKAKIHQDPSWVPKEMTEVIPKEMTVSKIYVSAG